MKWREKIARLLIRFGYSYLKVDMIGAAYRLVGIDMRRPIDLASETHLLTSLVFKELHTTELVLDVGANIGEYAQLLTTHFDADNVHSLEPNANCVQRLRDRLPNPVHEVALGAESGQFSFYHYEDDPVSSHGSLNIQSLVLDKPIEKKDVEVKRLSDFLLEEGLDTPSYVKIDTEGNDLEVIRGMGDHKNDIKFILFEFNDMYIYSGVFLREFYVELSEFDLYRVGEKGLVDIREYSPFYEVFRYQNILAVNKKLCLKMPKTF